VGKQICCHEKTDYYTTIRASTQNNNQAILYGQSFPKRTKYFRGILCVCVRGKIDLMAYQHTRNAPFVKLARIEIRCSLSYEVMGGSQDSVRDITECDSVFFVIVQLSIISDFFLYVIPNIPNNPYYGSKFTS
jgi:hypothetical protein